MSRLRRIADAIGIVISLLALLAAASSSGATGLQPEPILLSSEPSGIGITLHGPVDLAGKTPLDLQDLPIGEYSLRGRDRDLPAFRGRLVRGDRSLEPRSWAGVSSLLLPPGITHLGRGERRGWIFLGGSIASATMALVNHDDLREAESERDRYGREYATAVSEDDIRSAKVSLATAEQKVADQEELRNLWGIYLGATIAGAFLEAVVLTPEPRIEPLAAGGYVMRPPETGSFRNALRSALVPGAGQRFAGKEKKANAFTIATGLLAAATITMHSDFLEQRRDQQEAQSRFLEAETEQEIDVARGALRRAQDRTDEAEVYQWASAAALGVAYLWNVLDASMSAGVPRSIDAQPSAPPLAITWDPGDGELRIAASWGMR